MRNTNGDGVGVNLSVERRTLSNDPKEPSRDRVHTDFNIIEREI